MDRTGRVELTVLCLIADSDKILLQNRIKQNTVGPHMNQNLGWE